MINLGKLRTDGKLKKKYLAASSAGNSSEDIITHNIVDWGDWGYSMILINAIQTTYHQLYRPKDDTSVKTDYEVNYFEGRIVVDKSEADTSESQTGEYC